MTGVTQALSTATPYNPYDESNNISSNGAAYFHTPATFITPNQPVSVRSHQDWAPTD
jgi:hypothetical protein